MFGPWAIVFSKQTLLSRAAPRRPAAASPAAPWHGPSPENWIRARQSHSALLGDIDPSKTRFHISTCLSGQFSVRTVSRGCSEHSLISLQNAGRNEVREAHALPRSRVLFKVAVQGRALFERRYRRWNLRRHRGQSRTIDQNLRPAMRAAASARPIGWRSRRGCRGSSRMLRRHPRQSNSM